MRKLYFWMVAWIGLSLAFMVGIHWWDGRESKNQFTEMSAILQRQKEVSSLIVGFERYRRENTLFRKMTPEEIGTIKDQLKTETTRKIAQLQKLGASPEEQELGTKVLEGTSELMIQGSKIEQKNPLVRDLYQKEEIRDLHNTILTHLYSIQERIENTATKLTQASKDREKRNLKILIILAVQGFAGVGLLLLRQYMASARPLAILHKRMQAFRNGETLPPTKKLAGVYQELDSAIAELSSLVETQKKERHQFLIAVSQDLRAPLLTLQAGISRFLSGETSATEILSRSAVRVSKTLDALTDLIDMDRKTLLLNEEMIDLNELLTRTTTSLGGEDSEHPIRATLPKSSVWVFLDPKRFESVIISLVSKMTQHFPQGCNINLSLRRAFERNNRGLELLIQETQHSHGAILTDEKHSSNGPKLDVLQHWISENGFGMALAQKIMKAHGGSLQVSGLSGVGLEFSIFIPQERVASFENSTRMNGLTRRLESERVQPMLSEKSVNLSS